ncbi:hypothetical protein F6R98_19300 [Candidatus Methylospira mobilis]|uniref:Uncharacterized protein n=1 Tax=Candidatus Methylospira mobilis TaxID=1808979 RepID=A0A5Q0BQD4_9GAMM|nr:hypothetical protein [Candidatus Methylospira mobilis]QFY44511.1 hypothetical protein F6R98_19300 [Candidatus Methylospira mobilis]
MNLQIKLDMLNLETATKTQLATAIDSLIEQAQQDPDQRQRVRIRSERELKRRELFGNACYLEFNCAVTMRFI